MLINIKVFILHLCLEVSRCRNGITCCHCVLTWCGVIELCPQLDINLVRGHFCLERWWNILATAPGHRLNIMTVFPRYVDSHVKDKTVARPSYLQHGDPHTGKTASLYWDDPRESLKRCSVFYHRALSLLKTTSSDIVVRREYVCRMLPQPIRWYLGDGTILSIM